MKVYRLPHYVVVYTLLLDKVNYFLSKNLSYGSGLGYFNTFVWYLNNFEQLVLINALPCQLVLI